MRILHLFLLAFVFFVIVNITAFYTLDRSFLNHIVSNVITSAVFAALSVLVWRNFDEADDSSSGTAGTLPPSESGNVDDSGSESDVIVEKENNEDGELSGETDDEEIMLEGQDEFLSEESGGDGDVGGGDNEAAPSSNDAMPSNNSSPTNAAGLSLEEVSKTKVDRPYAPPSFHLSPPSNCPSLQWKSEKTSLELLKSITRSIGVVIEVNNCTSSWLVDGQLFTESKVFGGEVLKEIPDRVPPKSRICFALQQGNRLMGGTSGLFSYTPSSSPSSSSVLRPHSAAKDGDNDNSNNEVDENVLRNYCPFKFLFLWFVPFTLILENNCSFAIRDESCVLNKEVKNAMSTIIPKNVVHERVCHEDREFEVYIGITKGASIPLCRVVVTDGEVIADAVVEVGDGENSAAVMEREKNNLTNNNSKKNGRKQQKEAEKNGGGGARKKSIDDHSDEDTLDVLVNEDEFVHEGDDRAEIVAGDAGAGAGGANEVSKKNRKREKSTAKAVKEKEREKEKEKGKRNFEDGEADGRWVML